VDVFGNYARYYDLLYQDKDYLGETQFIQNLIQTHAPGAHSILELGCGTGIHASLLAQQGYQVDGVDISREMLQKAGDRLSNLPVEVSSRLNFAHGDIRQLRLNQTFDVILSLFHVISYQISNDDLMAAFTTVKQHLNPGGIFIFDVWYGPAVLSDRPSVRIKRFEDECILATRIAEPYTYVKENRVDINYQVFIRDKNTESVNVVNEIHQMRYIFNTEIEQILYELKMQAIKCREWMSDREPGFDTWGVYWIVRA
jgi:SAM-dependent methyltransferase